MTPNPVLLPSHSQRVLQFNNGSAIGFSNRWQGGQYCAILTKVGIVGCGVYDMKTPTEFNQAIAIARGTPAQPLSEPEDLLDARIVDCTPEARRMGVEPGMTGRDAVERMLIAADDAPSPRSTPPAIRVKHIDHVTFVVSDLERSRLFYRDVLGMQEVARPNFKFPGLWFQAGPTQIHLILEHPESGPAQVTLPERCAISRTRHVAFEIDDAEAAVNRLGELGVTIVDGPKHRPDGPTQLYVLDPDNNLIELFARR
jgi:catechol 2,3-dioxygenase-like lactoylglutathione lyase family enzyme/uncharacterized protein YunC (DUF1805 family)